MYSSPRFSIRHPREILVYWSQKDLDDAHAILNMYEDLDHAVAKSSAAPATPGPKGQGRRARKKPA